MNTDAAAWIIVIDDDIANLKIAGNILSENEMRVTALNSGQALLDYIAKGHRPDLILLDILMPNMDGFETLKRLRDYERANNASEIPVVFLTAGENKEMEAKGLETGALDFIRKPYEPDVLVHRIQNILSNSRKIQALSQEAATDKLTGLLNKASVNNELERECRENSGALLIIDLDSFKLVNDLYGHEAGDQILIAFAGLLKSHFRTRDIVGRIGGDEFVAFLKDTEDGDAIRKIIQRLNDRLHAAALEILGEDMTIPLGVSAGAVITTGGSNYFEMFKKADKALYVVKQNGKHDCYIHHEKDESETFDGTQIKDIKKLDMILNERNVSGNALWLGQESFVNIYRYMLRYIERYHEKAYKVLFTIMPLDDNVKESEFSEVVSDMGDIMLHTLRNSDIMMQNAPNQYFLLLPMVSETDIQKVIDRVTNAWKKAQYYDKLKVTYEAEKIDAQVKNSNNEKDRESWIVVVDDDVKNLKIAGRILSDEGMRVTALNSGQALLDFVSEGNRPDLVLLDILMPDMDGFETLEKLKKTVRAGEEIPVIFLTAVSDDESESRGLKLGAMDFIKKPFVPEVLTIRVRLNIDLVRLQRNLAAEVEKKTSENEELFLQVVMSLAGAIDAKDTYTNGHSTRVAEYSREIAKRYGYSEKEQRDIYMIGLLHDVGKIGVPDEVINKPSRLTDEEFAMIKNHPVMGAKILENIKNMPKLAIGARWHHERFGGGGYPDGLKGEAIPEEARIIAVADAYDAMTSNRSYRDVLAQEVVRGEIVKGKGTQFDPAFADLMLDMIDEDTKYLMRER